MARDANLSPEGNRRFWLALVDEIHAMLGIVPQDPEPVKPVVLESSVSDLSHMPFGTFKDYPMDDVPSYYCKWLADQEWIGDWPDVHDWLEEHDYL